MKIPFSSCLTGGRLLFPLYTESVKLLDSAEGIVRTHMRVLVLNVFRMADDAMSHFILSPAHRGVFRLLQGSSVFAVRTWAIYYAQVRLKPRPYKGLRCRYCGRAILLSRCFRKWNHGIRETLCQMPF